MRDQPRHVRAPRPGDTVTLHYRLTCSGSEIVNTFPDRPDTFVLGQGEIATPIEALIMTLTPGEHRHFALAPWEAFGERDDMLVHKLPVAEFPTDARLEVGYSAEFPLPNGENLLGTIVEIGRGVVTVDFNHPLAGLPVEIELELLATEGTATS